MLRQSRGRRRTYRDGKDYRTITACFITACFCDTNIELEAFEDWLAASGVHNFALNPALILAAPHSDLTRSLNVDSACDVGTCLRSLWRSKSYTLIFIGNFDNAFLGPPCRTLCKRLALRLAPGRLLL